MTPSKLGQPAQYERDVHALLMSLTITPVGAFTMGLLTAAFVRIGQLPSSDLMRKAANCISVDAAEDFVAEALQEVLRAKVSDVSAAKNLSAPTERERGPHDVPEPGVPDGL